MTFSLVGTVVEVIMWILLTVGLPGLFVLMAVESFGIPPLPSEVILPFAGFLIASGSFPLGGAIVASLAGGVAGSYAAYAVGRWGRHWLSSERLGPLRLDPKHLDAMDRWFTRRGEATVGLARLSPIIRSYISYPAGTARMEPIRFGLFTLAGATPFTLALLYAGFVLKANWSSVVDWFRYLDYAAVVAIVVLGLYLVARWRGWVAPGWPPRRLRATPTTPEATDPRG